MEANSRFSAHAPARPRTSRRFDCWVCATIVAMGLTVLGVRKVYGQVDTANVDGEVLDPSLLPVPNVKVNIENKATGFKRSTTSGKDGHFQFLALPPARYEVTVEAKDFKTYVNSEVDLTVGQTRNLKVNLELSRLTSEPTVVHGTPTPMESNRTAVAETVRSSYFANLPINGRKYTNFALLTPQASRDSSPSIGAAQTSGLTFGGNRPRSNQVSVDGADATDNSVNGVRSTVSQEAVQEFQIIISNYLPEYGRANGGVINIVTKSGGNTVHGNVFGYFRHKDIQARNPFSVEVDQATGAIRTVKQAYTRVETGATLGGPIKANKSFYFLSYETTRRQETGFNNIGSNNFDLVPSTTPVVPGLPLLLTPDQAAFVNNPAVLTAPGGAQVAATVALLGGSGSNVALNGQDYGAIDASQGVPPCPEFPKCFPIPVDAVSAKLPASYVPLRTLIGNYPISEGTSLWSARLDHLWNEKNNSFIRASASPSLATGIQVNAQNQNFGQNAGSRTSLQQYRDFAVVGGNTSIFSNTLVNQTRFQFARRGLHYGFSNLPGGDQVAVNITGFAFFGREPFSTVDRIERRWQWTDNVSWIRVNHSFKFGPDFNLIQVRSKKPQIFELNFGGIHNFGGLAASDLGLPSTFAGVPVPGITAVQSYGLGLPSVFIQGIGKSNRPFDNTALAGFFQDSWRVTRKLTLNYGVRYDFELTPVFTPGTAVNAVAEPAMGVMEGIPRDKNNWSPRIGLAWDPMGDGNTVIRAGYGVFFDHPLLAVAFNSTTADGALSSQLLSGGGTPTRASVLTDPTALNAASIFQGVLNAVPSMGYLPDQQRFDSKLEGSLFANQNFLSAGFPIPILPFTLPVARNFVYGYAQQSNLTVERRIAKDYRVSASYTYTHGLHLNRPRDVNVSDPGLMVTNFRNALAAGLSPSSAFGVVAPTTTFGGTAGTCGVTVLTPGVLGALTNCPGPLAPLDGQFIGTAAFFNFFRPSGPNPSFATLAGGYDNQVALAKLAGYPSGFGVPVPWSSVSQQESSGKSVYHGLTILVSKQISRNFEFLSGWTWSHTIDDSTDLQTLLQPQDNRHPGRERSNSTFDQRHRWITSASFFIPFQRESDRWLHKALANFVVSPVIEISSGRPFAVLTGTDFNLDLSSNTDRPSVATSGGVSSPFIPGKAFTLPTVCDQMITLGPNPISPPLGCTGNLSRNAFTRPGFAEVDLRISRKFFPAGAEKNWNIEFIADAFNLFNRFNVADVSPLCNPLDPATCRAGEPTASLDPRLFQFALRVNW